MKRGIKLLYGVGITDLDVSTIVNGKQVICNAYKRWQTMLSRCYNEKFHEKQPRYKDCFVSEEWLTFSNFKRWLISQDDWQNLQLDKDLIFHGNKEYSKETCFMVSRQVNMFTTERNANRGEYMIGVTNGRRGNGYRASLGPVYLGQYATEIEAHDVWWSAKCLLAEKLASEQTNPMVANALRMRYTGMSPYRTFMSTYGLVRIDCLRV